MMALAIALLFISILSIVLDRRSQKRRRARLAAKAAAEAAEQANSETIASVFSEGWRSRIAWGRQSEGSDPFKGWLSAVLLDAPDEKAWLASLPPEEIKPFIIQIKDFCLALHIEPDWLVNPKLAQDAALRQWIKDFILDYIRLHHKAALHKPDLSSFSAYRAIESKPESQENQRIMQHLYTRLVHEGLSPAVQPELLLADEKARQQEILKFVQSAATQDYHAFIRALKVVLSELAADSSSGTPHPVTLYTPQGIK